MIVKELGILPRDQLVSLDACIFVEGPADQVYLETVAKTLKSCGKLQFNFDERNIGIVPFGGDNLRFYVERGLLKKLHRKFAVVVDSDKKNSNDSISQECLRWKTKCESEGGIFIILRKRAIENYLHPESIKRVLERDVIVDDFNEVKSQISSNYNWRRHLKPIVEAMSVEEILEMDKYYDENHIEIHELIEIIKRLLELTV